VKKNLEGTDTDAIRTSAEQLATVSQKMGAAMYAQQQSEAPADGADASAGAQDQDDEVVDAEIVDDEKDKKSEDGAK